MAPGPLPRTNSLIRTGILGRGRQPGAPTPDELSLAVVPVLCRERWTLSRRPDAYSTCNGSHGPSVLDRIWPPVYDSVLGDAYPLKIRLWNVVLALSTSQVICLACTSHLLCFLVDQWLKTKLTNRSELGLVRGHLVGQPTWQMHNKGRPV